MKNYFREVASILRRHKKAFVWLNIAYFGLMIAFMVYGALNPDVVASFEKMVEEQFSQSGYVSEGREATEQGNLVMVALMLFLANFFGQAFLSTTLPSFIIPFSGILVGLYRAAIWGLKFAPVSAAAGKALIPHYFLLLIEGEATVLAMLCGWIGALGLFAPAAVGRQGNWKGYLEGWRSTAYLYGIIFVVLLVAGFYEAFELIYL